MNKEELKQEIYETYQALKKNFVTDIVFGKETYLGEKVKGVKIKTRMYRPTEQTKKWRSKGH